MTLNRNCKNYNDNFMQIKEDSTGITGISKSLINLIPFIGSTLSLFGEWVIKRFFKIDQDEKYKNEFKLFKRFGDKYDSKTFKKLVKENWGISIVKNEKMKQIIDNIEDVIPENEETDAKGFGATFKDKLWKINSFDDSLVKPANLSKVENFVFSNFKAFARDLMKITIKEGVRSKPEATYDYEEKIKFDNIINFLINETDRKYKAQNRPKTCWQKYCCKLCDFCLCCISIQE